ncbi:MAG: hypothetical protein KDD10_09020 [Phaeodactylibacter sp.]|nr:hypothetical protein [Phaeodactylibacter sp.]
MSEPKVFLPFQFLLFSLVFITSCSGPNPTGLPKDSIKQIGSKPHADALDPFEQQYYNLAGKWTSVSSDKKAFGTLELFENGDYLLMENGDKGSGKWRIVDVHHLSLGDLKYRFFFKGENLVLVGQEGKYELAKQNAGGSDIQSILNSDTLISPFVRRIFQDKIGNLWFGTQGDGTARYDGDTLEYFSVNEGFGGVVVRAIAGDAAGNVWFGTERGLTKYNGAAFTNYTEKDGLAHNDVWSMAIDREGIIWIGTLRGVSRFNGEVFTPFGLPEAEPDPNRGVTSSRIVHSIMEDRHGKMWFGTNGGAYIYDGSLPGGQGGPLTNISTKDGLPDNSVNDILEDKDGNIWFATHYKGVCYWDGTSFTRIPTKERDSGTEVWSLFEDHSGNIWFPIESFGVYCYNGGSAINFHGKDGLASGAIQCIFEDKEGRIWLGGWMGLFCYGPTTNSGQRPGPGGKSFFMVTKYGPWP